MTELIIGGSGGSGTPGGATTNVQFNLSGAFSGDSGFTYAGSGGGVGIGISAATITPGQLVISPTITAQTAALSGGIVQISPAITFSSANTFTGLVFAGTVTGSSTSNAINITTTFNNSTAAVIGLSTTQTENQTVSPFANTMTGNSSAPRIGATNSQNWTATSSGGGLVGFSGMPRINAGATGTISMSSGFVSAVNNLALGATITSAFGFNSVNPTATGPITTYAAYYSVIPTTATNNVVLGAGTLTTGNFFIYDNSGYASQFSGAVSGVTAALSDNSTKFATTAWVSTQPVFHGKLVSSAQTISNSTWTKVSLDTVTDPNGYWNASTHVYTPLIAGTYEVSASLAGAGTTVTTLDVAVSKNGTVGTGTAVITQTNVGLATSSAQGVATSAALVSMNGTTDTLELDAFILGTGTETVTNNTGTNLFIRRVGP